MLLIMIAIFKIVVVFFFQPAAQYGGIPAIPSPPTVYTPQAELYPTFQINNPQVNEINEYF